MATDVSVGDSETPYLDVTPADVDTVAALVVTAPDGTTTPITASGGALTVVDGTASQRWTASANVVYSAAGRWLLTWTVTGTGEGVETQEVYVVASPTAGGPTWLPGRSRVASYVPTRTLSRNPASYAASGDAYALTFDSTTRPSGVMVDRLIADAASWIGLVASPVHASLSDAASTCAAIWVAAAVERGWPDDDTSLQRARDLQALADRHRDDLAAAQDRADGESDDTFGIDVVEFDPYSAYRQPL